MKSKICFSFIFVVIFFFLLALHTRSITAEDSARFQNKSYLASQQRLHSNRGSRIQEKRERLIKAGGFANVRKPNAEIAASLNVDLLGVWPYGSCMASDLDTSIDIAVIGSGKAALILDISVPSSPTVIGSTGISVYCSSLAITTNYAYTGGGGWGWLVPFIAEGGLVKSSSGAPIFLS